jgi:uncharacterized protein (TIGR04255 family)
MKTALPEPLGGPPPPEINLPRAPLVRVLAQARFPGILKIDNKEVVSSFQEQIRGEYPLFEPMTSQQVEVQVVAGNPTVRQVPSTVWTFSDAEKNWRVALASDSVSLETGQYTNRDDFLARWTTALGVVERVFNPQIALRVGIRYIDRVMGQPFGSIEDLVRKDILGVATREIRQHVRHALTEATLATDEGEMLLRWGILPANATIDPGLLPPVSEMSWLLDIDVYSGEQRSFLSMELEKCFRALAERAYSVFRFMTTERFLTTYGAEV